MGILAGLLIGWVVGLWVGVVDFLALGSRRSLCCRCRSLNDCVSGCGESSVEMLWGHLRSLYTLLDFNNRVLSETSGRIG
jgi:hypothetical protein